MHLEPGQQLGSYDLLDRVGSGAMGQVFRARDTELGREVAIKVLPDELNRDPERLRRFANEARALASLNDPNVAILFAFESGADGEPPFLVMELVDGETLGPAQNRTAFLEASTAALRADRRRTQGSPRTGHRSSRLEA